MYRYIIFDADNTILDFSRSEADALTKTLSDNGIVDFDESLHIPLYQRINGEIWREFENGDIDADSLKRERFRRFFAELGLSPPLDSISDTYLVYLSRTSFYEPGAKKLLTELKETHSLALITNGLIRVQKPRFKQSGLDRFFPVALISEELGVSKPDPEIFELACNRLGVKDKCEVLMVGDNINSDIKGGLEYGIDACWYNPEGKPREKGIVPTYEIKKLEELKSCLNGEFRGRRT